MIFNLLNSYTNEDEDLGLGYRGYSNLEADIFESDASCITVEKEELLLLRTSSNLANLIHTIENDSEEGGLNPQAARYAVIAFNSILGTDSKISEDMNEPYPFATLESSGGCYTLEDSSRSAAKEGKSVLERIWNAIVRAVKSSIAKVNEFIYRLKGGNKRLLSDIKELLESLKGSKDNWEKGKTIDINNWAQSLHYQGKMDVTSVKTAMNNSEEEVINNIEFIDKFAEKYYMAISKVYGHMQTKEVDFNEVVEMIYDHMRVEKDNQTMDMLGLVRKTMTKPTKGNLAGNRLINFEIVSDSTTGIRIKTYAIDTYETRDRRIKTRDFKSETGSWEDHYEILTKAKNLSETVDLKNDRIKRLNELRDECIAKGAKIVKNKGLKLHGLWAQGLLHGVLRLANFNIVFSVRFFSAFSYSAARSAYLFTKEAVLATTGNKA